MTGDQLMVRLRALPGVTVEQGESPENFSYYILHFTQPIDHNDPTKGTFQQQVSLLHRNEFAPFPMIIYTSGYDDDERNSPVELTELLDANQVSIEHRFYGTSLPDPLDWSKLTVDQAAADEHDVITALHTIYEGAFLSVGESKGGITALIHRSFYPEDVNGTVAYVAPLSFNAPDPRYPAQFDQIGTVDCRAAVRNIASEMLARREQMVMLAQSQADQAHQKYTRVKIGPAVEAAVSGLEWGFWQMAGDGHCDEVPLTTASDADLFAFLDAMSPVHQYNDKQLGYYDPYYYQSYAQLGYPDDTVAYLANQLWYSDADYEGELPTVEPAFDPDPMDRVQKWLESAETDEHDPKTRADLGKHLMFIYGKWDPWFAGRVAVGDAGDTATFIKPTGNHDTKLATLDPQDQVPAFTYLKQWTGADPKLWRLEHHTAEAVSSELGHRRLPPPLRAAHARPAPR